MTNSKMTDSKLFLWGQELITTTILCRWEQKINDTKTIGSGWQFSNMINIGSSSDFSILILGNGAEKWKHRPREKSIKHSQNVLNCSYE